MAGALLMALFHTAAAQEFTGKLAADIDWAVKNCECKSTDQEHLLVEQANASDKSRGAFQRAYLAQFQSKDLSEALADDRARQSKCEALKGLYGPMGTLASGLISWDKAPASTSTSSMSSAVPAGSKRGRRHAQ